MNEPPVTRAFFIRQTAPGKGSKVEVHFNPASLLYEITNTLDNKGSGNKKKQYVSQSTGKLTMELMFDTTDSGQDVRIHTEKVARFMEPQNKVPPVVSFEWGAYKFQGALDSYKETIDFFSAGGVPLRAKVNLSMSRQDKVFESGGHGSADTGGSLKPEPVEVPAPRQGGAAGVTSLAGDPRAARDVAAQNGEESLRFSESDSFVLGDDVPLGPPVAFASGGIGASAGGGFGIGGGFEAGIGGGIGASGGFGVGGGFEAGFGGGAGAAAGFGAGAGVSFSAGASASFGEAGGGAVFGGRASARVTASAGAFAGLRLLAAERRRRPRLRLESFLEQPEGTELSTDAGARFQLGGQADLAAPVSMGADVGASASLRSRIEMDEE